jgi:hypothetical protein
LSHAAVYLNKPEAASDFTPNISLASSRLVSSSSLSNLTAARNYSHGMTNTMYWAIYVLSVFLISVFDPDSQGFALVLLFWIRIAKPRSKAMKLTKKISNHSWLCLLFKTFYGTLLQPSLSDEAGF